MPKSMPTAGPMAVAAVNEICLDMESVTDSMEYRGIWRENGREKVSLGGGKEK